MPILPLYSTSLLLYLKVLPLTDKGMPAVPIITPVPIFKLPVNVPPDNGRNSLYPEAPATYAVNSPVAAIEPSFKKFFV